MAVKFEEEKALDYIVIKVGDKTYSTSYQEITEGKIKGKMQIVDTKGIGEQSQLWIKGSLTEEEKHKELKEVVPFEINLYFHNLSKGGLINMGSLKEEAQAYTPKQTLNIADLEKVYLKFPLESREGTDSEGKTFSYKVMIANGVEYRVPNTVIEEIQKILKLKPDTEVVRVRKTGSGLNTRYSVEVVE